ncbi:MAG: hypothetical protein SFV23_19885 [Planctomycetaceae bacterium]|nr:hypothetical protein [Planctomycetaceae bacterium]
MACDHRLTRHALLWLMAYCIAMPSVKACSAQDHVCESDAIAAMVTKWPRITDFSRPIDMKDYREKKREGVPDERDVYAGCVIQIQGESIADNAACIDDEFAGHLKSFEYLQDLSVGLAFTNKGAERLVNNKRLSSLILAKSQVTDDCFLSLSKLPALTELDLSGTAVGQTEVFEKITMLKNLRFLSLRRTSVRTRKHCEAISQLEALDALDLLGLPIDDHAALALLSLKKLEMLDLTATEISPSMITRFKQSLPAATILSDDLEP